MKIVLKFLMKWNLRNSWLFYNEIFVLVIETVEMKLGKANSF